MRDEIFNLIVKFSGQNNLLAIPREFINITEDINSALLLSQLLYWTSKSKNDGWIYKTYKDWNEEIGLSEYQVRLATKKLKSLHLVETKIKKANGNPTLHYRLDTEETKDWILKKLKKPITETTTETTTKKESTNVLSPTRLDEINDVFSYYLDTANKMKQFLSDNNIKTKNSLTVHKSLKSKCTVSLPDDKENAVTIPIIDIIDEYLNSYTTETFKKALDNYYTVFISNLQNKDMYYYTTVWKTIGSFIYSGVHRGTGFKSLLDLDKLKKGFTNNVSEIDQLRSEFKPITKEYDQLNVLNKETNTYYGFSTDKLRNSYLMREYVADIKDNYNKSKFMLGDFCYLEEAIASIFFSRKSGYDMELLKALMSIWKEMKPKFKRKIIDLL